MGGLLRVTVAWRLLRISVDQRCEGVEVQLVAAAGPVLPVRVDRGELVGRFTGLTLSPEEPWEVPFMLPARMSKPFWLRCFVVQPAGIRVLDPIDEMKVS